MKAFLFFTSFIIIVTHLSAQTRKDSLLVFVGEKILVKELPQENEIVRIDTVIENGDTFFTKRFPAYSLDSKFLARYKVLQKLHGSFKNDTVEFLAYDHYGPPGFSNYKTVLLYVSNVNGILVHEKYQFADVYKTKNGRWASGYKLDNYRHELNNNTIIKPEPIHFVTQVSYKLNGRTKEQVAEWFPSPYYLIKNDSAIVVYGNYVEQLFELKKSGILRARGIF